MQQSSIFRWPIGNGWLVLSSGGRFQNAETEAIDTRMLNQSAADGPLAYIGAAHDFEMSEQYLDYLTDLGGRSGYPVDIIAEDDDSLHTQIGEAGVVVIGDGPYIDRLFNGMHGAAINAVRTAYERGALVMGSGIGAEVFGQWLVRPHIAGVRQGLGWLLSAAILTGTPDDANKQTLQSLLQGEPTAFGLAIRPGSALALGPAGQVELWGKQQIAISLGRAYSVRD